jgi:hypothetical protein
VSAQNLAFVFVNLSIKTNVHDSNFILQVFILLSSYDHILIDGALKFRGNSLHLRRKCPFQT